ncbi:MAG: carboxypeptidase-like regulatory domain-containing protein [Planctomycetota bacterium]
MDGTIQGKVVDVTSGRPHPQIAVQLFREREGSRALVAETTSGGDGSFSFGGLASSTYVLATRVEGDAPLVGEVTVADLADGEYRAVTLEVERRYVICGTVIEQGTGRPIAGVTITLHRMHGYRSPDDLYRDLAETGPNGTFRSSFPAYPGNASLVVHRGAEGLYANFWTHGLVLKHIAIGSEKLTDLVLPFPWTGVARGRVLGPDGRPVSGARVIVLDPNRNYDVPWEDQDTRGVTSAEDGTFLIDRLPTDRPLVLEVTASSHARTASRPFEAREREPAASPEIVVTMRRIARLRVRVVDEDGRPIVGAFVHASALRGGIEPVADPVLSPEQEEVALVGVATSVGVMTGRKDDCTSEAGIKDLELAPGTYFLQAFKTPEVNSDLITVTVQEGENSIQVKVTKRVSITGKVVTSDGKPLRWVSVTARALEGESWWQDWVQNRKGQFTLRSLAPGRYTLTASRLVHKSAPVEAVAPSQGVQLVWDPPETRTLAVRVMDHASGEGISGASVLMQPSSGQHPVVFRQTTNEWGAAAESVPPGDYTVFAGKRGYATGSVSVEVPKGEPPQVILDLQLVGDWTDDRMDEPVPPVIADLRLKEGQSVRGWVMDQEGSPVTGAQVAAVGAQWFPLESTAVLTGADGSFTLDSLPQDGGPIGVISKKSVADAITTVAAGATGIVLVIRR